MSRIIKTFIKNIKKYKKSGFFRAKFIYTKFLEKLDIDENLILIQSYDGSSISGNPYYLLKELCENEQYKNYKKIVVVRNNNKEEINEKIECKQWKNVKLVKIHSKEYCKALVIAKYLINNSTFPTYFIKKKNQVYFNTWHGIPLKTLGKSIEMAPNELGNTQRNFMMADYLLYPNEFMFNIMRRDYMLNNLFKGKYILAGYPRNTAFFDENLKKEIIEKYKIENKRIIVFMPTWRGSLDAKNTDEQMVYIKHAIYEMEEKLDENTVVFVKLHNYVNKKLNMNKFKKIRKIPEEYETYEFLNVADCLVTDYSSVLWDFSNTNKKIILYAYDLERYSRERGMYIDMKELPFSIVYTSNELINEIKSESYNSYKNEIKDMVKYDGNDSSEKICKYIFNGELDSSIKVIDGKQYNNKKENVLLFSGALNKNGITTAFKSLIKNLDKDKNYIITFFKKAVNKNRESIKEFSNNDYIVIQGQKDMTIKEAVYHFLYFKLNIATKRVMQNLDKIYKREINRIYPNMKIEYAINFSGYESNMMHIISHMNAKKFIWAHNNMYEEQRSKKNFHKKSLMYAYKKSDKVVVVRESMKQELEKYLPKKQKNKIVVVHNINDIETVKEKANKEIEFEEDTFCNVELEELKSVLENKSINKFINIARFSKEKGLDRLILAFDRYRKTSDKNAYLIIVGGYGKEFQNILSIVQEKELDNIIIIRSVSNPYPILKKCNVFVLSSIYEGLPMTIMEALILNKIVISTDIAGPKEFLKKGYGYLVENSEDGILKGLEDYKNGKIKNLKKFDAQKFNQKAKEEFYDLFKL